MDKHLTDAEAVCGAESFVLLFDRHFRVVHRYVRRRLGADLADELAAETFARAFAARSSYDRRWPDARPWLLGIASNLVRRHHRAEERRWRAYRRYAGGDQGSGEARMVDGSGEAALASGLAELSAGERDVLLLYAWFDLSYGEIALALGVPVGTVRSRLNSGRRRMRATVGERGADGPAPGDSTVWIGGSR
jgi:RNA polymerase sigma-70 factor (ECF subfamily)